MWTGTDGKCERAGVRVQAAGAAPRTDRRRRQVRSSALVASEGIDRRLIGVVVGVAVTADRYRPIHASVQSTDKKDSWLQVRITEGKVRLMECGLSFSLALAMSNRLRRLSDGRTARCARRWRTCGWWSSDWCACSSAPTGSQTCRRARCWLCGPRSWSPSRGRRARSGRRCPSDWQRGSIDRSPSSWHPLNTLVCYATPHTHAQALPATARSLSVPWRIS